MVQSIVRLPVIKQISRHIFSYSRADWDSISAELEELQSTFNDVDPYYQNTESLWSMFHDKLFSLIDQYISSRNCRKRHDLPWLTPMLRRKIRCKNKLSSVHHYSEVLKSN